MAKAAIYPTIPNAGSMSEFIGAFDIPSKVTDYVYHCRFSHCWNGIATRHSDTMDCKFVVDGKGVVLGLAHPGFVGFRERAGRNLTDREASYLAAEYLRERLEQEDEHQLYDISTSDVTRLIEKLATSLIACPVSLWGSTGVVRAAPLSEPAVFAHAFVFQLARPGAENV